jgi:hypothetical protein
MEIRIAKAAQKIDDEEPLAMALSYYYIFIVAILLPVFCIRSYFKSKAGAPLPLKASLRVRTLLLHGLLLLLAPQAAPSFFAVASAR